MTSRRSPLSAVDIVTHPEFEHVTWPLKPAEKGKFAVAKGRGGPIQISYEIHGTGPMKLVVSLQVLLTVLICQRESRVKYSKLRVLK